MAGPLFVEATFRADGLVFSRFAKAARDGWADLRVESYDPELLHGRFVVHGIGERGAEALAAALAKAYEAPTDDHFDPVARTYAGRIRMPLSRIYGDAATGLLLLRDRFDPPWLRFEGQHVTIRTPAPRATQAAQQLEATLRHHDPDAAVRIGPLEGRPALIWSLMVEREEAARGHGVPVVPLVNVE